MYAHRTVCHAELPMFLRRGGPLRFRVSAYRRWKDLGVNLPAGSEPWSFTQQPPMTTLEFCKAADRRGVFLDNAWLRELWRIGALAPLVEVRRRRSGTTCPSPIEEPRPFGTWGSEVRVARDAGRLVDPEVLGFRHQLRFERPKNASSRWWNGLLYSRWQFLAIERFSWMLPARGRYVRPPTRLSPLSDQNREAAAQHRKVAHLLVALEARYLPEIKKPWVRLTNASFDDWYVYRDQFNPSAVVSRYGWTAEALAGEAELLLFRAERRDPLKGEWSQLVARASTQSWEQLEGDALLALDLRIGAEILLLCYEDMAERDQAPPLADRPGWSASKRRRLSQPPTPLDRSLSALGLSPHPGVVLVIEGETEELLVPRVRDRLRFDDSHGIVRPVVMRGSKAGLTKLVGFAAGPLIEKRQGEHWLLVKPPTRVFVAVDPDPPFDTQVNIDNERRKIIEEIVAVIRAQGVDPERRQLESLVRIETWTHSCFEFAHFDDEELATALEASHRNCNGLGHQELAKAIGQCRAHQVDIKQVWSNWRPKPSKRAVAEQLWPTLERKVIAALANPNAAVPEVMARLQDAYLQAGDRPAGAWVLRGRPMVS
jgi:hypothetical protein